MLMIENARNNEEIINYYLESIVTFLKTLLIMKMYLQRLEWFYFERINTSLNTWVFDFLSTVCVLKGHISANTFKVVV